MSTQWLTVSEVAARLKISERTVQRRCKSGRLQAHLETGEDGAAWLIDSATLPTSDAIAADAAANLPTGDDTTFEREGAPSVVTGAPGAAIVTTSADNALLAHLQSENVFLRGQIEAHARAEAELRAALRKALDAMPKAIEAPRDENAQNTPQTAATGKEAAGAQNTLKSGTEREIRPLWKVILGIR